jgi:hypothetical protein
MMMIMMIIATIDNGNTPNDTDDNDNSHVANGDARCQW